MKASTLEYKLKKLQENWGDPEVVVFDGEEFVEPAAWVASLPTEEIPLHDQLEPGTFIVIVPWGFRF